MNRYSTQRTVSVFVALTLLFAALIAVVPARSIVAQAAVANAVSAQEPVFDDEAGSLTLPSSSDVRYSIVLGNTAEGNTPTWWPDASKEFVAAGVYKTADGLPRDELITVIASPRDVNAQLQGTTQWQHIFARPAKSTVKAVAPEANFEKASITIPSVTNVEYHLYPADANGAALLGQEIFLNGDTQASSAAPGVYSLATGLPVSTQPRNFVVVAKPVDSATTALDGTTEWLFQLALPLPTAISAPAPVFVDPNPDTGSSEQSVTIPQAQGVNYRVFTLNADGTRGAQMSYPNGASVAPAGVKLNASNGLPGVGKLPASIIVVAEASDAEGTYISGVSSWTHVFPGTGILACRPRR